MEDKSYSLAVFIDYENLALGTGKRDPRGHQRPGPPPQMNKVLERLVEKGRINVKRAYCDWQRFSGAVTPLHELGIELIEIPDRAHTGKNSADIRLSVDAMEVCFTKEHIDVFVICSGDSDFSPLVAKLKEHGKHVIGVGMKEATSSLLVHNCDEFIYYEDIGLSLDAPEYRGIVPVDKEEVYRLLFTTVEALNRENIDRMQASLIKDAMRRKRPEFSESNYGYRNFTQLLQEAERYGFIVLSMDKLSGTWCVEGFNSQPIPLQGTRLVNRYSSYKPQRSSYRSSYIQQGSNRPRKTSNQAEPEAWQEDKKDEAAQQPSFASSLLRSRRLRRRGKEGKVQDETSQSSDTAVQDQLNHDETVMDQILDSEQLSVDSCAEQQEQSAQQVEETSAKLAKPTRKRSTRKKKSSEESSETSESKGAASGLCEAVMRSDSTSSDNDNEVDALQAAHISAQEVKDDSSEETAPRTRRKRKSTQEKSESDVLSDEVATKPLETPTDDGAVKKSTQRKKKTQVKVASEGAEPVISKSQDTTVTQLETQMQKVSDVDLQASSERAQPENNDSSQQVLDPGSSDTSAVEGASVDMQHDALLQPQKPKQRRTRTKRSQEDREEAGSEQASVEGATERDDDPAPKRSTRTTRSKRAATTTAKRTSTRTKNKEVAAEGSDTTPESASQDSTSQEGLAKTEASQDAKQQRRTRAQKQATTKESAVKEQADL